MIDRLKADKLVKTTDSGKQFHRHSASEKVLSDTLIYSKMHTETQTDRQTDRQRNVERIAVSRTAMDDGYIRSYNIT